MQPSAAPRLAQHVDEALATDFIEYDEGLKLLNEIERLQDHVLEELDSLNGRIQSVFRAFGYKEAECLDDLATIGNDSVDSNAV